MANSTLAEGKREAAARESIKTFFDESIDKMSPRKLRAFEKRADEIVARAKNRASRAAAGSRENAQSKPRASRA
jgi:CRISPR/Cas system CSM-associated protein Csm2 small subunit